MTTTAKTAKTKPQLSIREHVELMTGYDEDLVAKKFGEFDDLTATKQMRALAFLQFKRGGATEADAYKQAMGMTLKEVSVGTFFAEPEPELDDEDPEGDEGKDDSPGD